MEPLKDRIATSVVWVVGSRGVLQLLTFASTLVVARLLTPGDYGLMALATMWTFIVSMLTELGLAAAILQFRDTDDRELNTCFWATVCVATAGYVVLYACAPALGAWFANPALPSVLRVLALTLPLCAVRSVPETLLRKQLRLDQISRAEIASALAAIPVVLATAAAGGGVWALVAWQLTVAVVQGALTLRFARWWPGLRIGSSRLAALMRYNLAWFGTRLCWAAYGHADTFVLGRISGGVVLGFYSMGKELAMLPVEKIAPIANQIAFPVMAELQRDRQAVGSALLRGVRLVGWITLPVCLALGLVARDLVHVVLTDKWAPAVPIIHVFCVYAATRSLTLLFPTALMARYRGRFVFAYNLVLLALLPAAFGVGAFWSNALGVAVAWAVIQPLVMIWVVRETLKELELPAAALLRVAAGPLAAALLMLAPMLLVHGALASVDGVVRLLAVSLAGGAAYVVGVWWFGGSIHGDIGALTRRVFRAVPPPLACMIKSRSLTGFTART